MKTSLLILSTVGPLKDLNIGYHLPRRHRSNRGVKRKKQNLHSFIVCLVGDMNIHFDNPLQSLTKQTLSTLSLYGLVQVINKPTHRCGHIIDWVIVRPDDDIHRKSTVTDSLESDHYCTKSYFNISVSKPNLLKLKLKISNLLLNFPVFQSFHLLKMQTSSVTFAHCTR